MRRYLSHLRYVFRPEDMLGKSHKPLSINVFQAQGVDFESLRKPGRETPCFGEGVEREVTNFRLTRDPLRYRVP
jgi:hypothetical protein